MIRVSHVTLRVATIVCAAATLVLVLAASRHSQATIALALAGTLQIALVGMVLATSRSSERRMRRLERLAEWDPGTACLNRRGFHRALDDALRDALPTHREIALLAVDLDHFKDVNDRFGHNVGDAVLADVGAALASTVGRDGSVARLGGEEFAVLLPDADAEAAGVMAERLLLRMRALEPTMMPHSAHVTASVGIAAERVTSPMVGAELRARADEALYLAKRSGRDRVLLWAPGVRSLATPAASIAIIAQDGRWFQGGLEA